METGLPVVAAALLGTLTLVSCATTPKPIPVSGAPADLSQLAGEWSGEYHGAAGGRSGLVSFKLSAGADSASGDVLMFPRQRPEATTPERHGTVAPNVPQGLTINFVRAANGMVSGRLDPYNDPECGCLVDTVFEGRLEGDTIEGRYVSHRSGTSTVTGQWKVTRKK